MQIKPVTILVLDADQRSALAVVRSLGRHKDLRVIAADELPIALAGTSKYCQAYFQYPSPRQSPEMFAQWLIPFVAAQEIDWLFPTTEISSQSILLLRDQLGKCRVPYADYSTVLALADKAALTKLAAQLNVPCPNSQYFNNSSLLAPGSIAKFPVVLKPNLSRLRLPSGWLETSVHIAHTQAELSELLTEKPYFREHPFMLQEFIPGKGAGIFALYGNGKPISFFAHRRIREKPPSGGVSVLSESAPLEPTMLAIAKKLLDAVCWHGVAMVEFRIANDGTPYLMEVNTRFWGSLQLAVDSGIDFPYWLYQVCNEENPSIQNYRLGRRLRWLLGDIDNLYLTLRNKRTRLPEKLKQLFAFFIPRPFSTRHEINRWADFAPAWHELKEYVKALRR